MLKADKRALKRQKAIYGHCGAGSVHTRQASDLEVLRHIQKIEQRRNKQR